MVWAEEDKRHLGFVRLMPYLVLPPFDITGWLRKVRAGPNLCNQIPWPKDSSATTYCLSVSIRGMVRVALNLSGIFPPLAAAAPSL